MTDDNLYQDDMSQIADPGEIPPPGDYRVRVAEVRTHDETGNQLMSKAGKPKVQLLLKVQNEGPLFGRTIPDSPSLEPTALFKLKAYYNAIEYHPTGGHNPKRLLDGEFWIHVEASTYQGNPSFNIPPWGVRSLAKGPASSQARAKAS